MDYEKKTKGELISELKSLKSKVESFEHKQPEEKFRRLVENLQDNYFFYAHNIDGIFTYISPSLTNILGYTAEEFLTHYSEYLTDNPINKEVEGHTELSTKGIKQPPYEVEIYHKDGSIRSLHVQEVPVFDNNRNVIAVEGIAQDITERKRSEEQIASKAHILEESLNEIYIFDAKTLRLLHVNKAARLNLGYSKEELRSHTALDLKPEFTSESFKKLIEPLLTGKKNKVQFTTFHRRKDDSSYDVEVHLQLSTFQSKPAFVAITLDITERRKIEEELIKIQQLDCVGVLAGGIAHDFNNCLQAIMGYVSLVKLRTAPNDENYEILEEAGKVVLHAKSLTRQLLTFSKGGDPVKEIISVSELISDSTKLASSGSSAKCELLIQECLWQIEADKGQLSQVISNLILNADQAMQEGGTIKIRAENINIIENDILPLKEGRYIKIAVEDHGIGILQEQLQKIFDPYFTTKQEGSGLGLATAYSIIKKHGGHITVDSEIEVGTTFHIHLPALQKEIPKEPDTIKAAGPNTKHLEKKDAGEPATSKGRILIMDDEPIIRTILCKQLRVLDYEVDSVEEGSEAIRSYKNANRSGKPFDAVILDLTIPGGIGGKATIKKLLEIDPEVKAIVSSGYANDPVMADHINYGFKSVLAKPHGIYELDETLQKIIA